MKTTTLLVVLLVVIVTSSTAQVVEKSSDKGAAAVDAAKLQNLQTIEQWAAGMRDDKIGALTEAQLADLGWRLDQEYSRALFRFALVRVQPGQNDDAKEISAKTTVTKKIAVLIAKHDTTWAKTLLSGLTKDRMRKAWSQVEAARDLVDVDPKAAVEFAEDSLKVELTPLLTSFLQKLRRTDQGEANRLFIQVVSQYVQQRDADAVQFGNFGNYMFRARNSEPDQEGSVMVVVGKVLMPEITANQPWATQEIVQPYLRAAIALLNQPSVDVDQRSKRYALGHILMPKAQEFAPSLGPEIAAAMAALSTSVPAEYRTDEAYKYLTKQPSAPEDRLKEIEASNPDPYIRDPLYADMAFHAARTNKFDVARLAIDKIEGSKLKDEMELILNFAEINQFLKGKAVDLADGSKRLSKMPETLEKCMLSLAAAAVADKVNNRTAAGEFLESAWATTKRLNDEISPFVLMYISAEMRRRKDADASTLFDEATKEFNKYDRLLDPDLEHKIEFRARVETSTGTVPAIYYRYPLAVKDVDLAFAAAFAAAVKGDEENAILQVNDIRDERLKGEAYVALARAILAKPAPAKVPEGVVKVSEDEFRKLAWKQVMPVYPAALLKARTEALLSAEVRVDKAGIVTDVKVLETPNPLLVAALVEAVKQWKFKPAQADGKPIGQSGKLTFAFTVNGQGKGDATLAKSQK